MMRDKQLQDHPDSVMELKLITEKILVRLRRISLWLKGQTKIQKDIHEIKMSMFDPDNGLYARVNKNTGFRLTAGKWLWVLTTGLLMSLLHGFMRYVLK